MSRSGLLLFLLAVSSSAAAQDANAKAILGLWRGTSVCVNREAAPACRDEEVIYDFREATPPAAGKLTLKADKIEGGKVVPMGVLDLVWDPAERAWSCDFQNARFHGLWSFKPKGDDLTGTLLLLPERTRVREAAARRSPKA